MGHRQPHVIAPGTITDQSWRPPDAARPTAPAALGPAELGPGPRRTARHAGAPGAGAPPSRNASSALASFAAVAAGAAAAVIARWAWEQWERTEVSGDSMAPALQAGDHLLVWRTKRLKVGDIVAAGDPRRPERTVLKRAASVDAAGVFLVGDNEERSTDSRHFGPVARPLVRGRAVYRYAPPGRAGRL